MSLLDFDPVYLFYLLIGLSAAMFAEGGYRDALDDSSDPVRVGLYNNPAQVLEREVEEFGQRRQFRPGGQDGDEDQGQREEFEAAVIRRLRDAAAGIDHRLEAAPQGENREVRPVPRHREGGEGEPGRQQGGCDLKFQQGTRHRVRREDLGQGRGMEEFALPPRPQNGPCRRLGIDGIGLAMAAAELPVERLDRGAFGAAIRFTLPPT